MSSIQERLQLKRVPLDTWNIREQLCLASAVVRSGDQNWMSVSRALKTIGESNRPPDWYSQKSCAAQYGALLEHVETPKRKKRSSEGAVETPQESILKRLTQERIVEIQKTLAEMNQQYDQLKNEITEVRNQSTSEERLKEIWNAIEARNRAREKETARRAAWLKERDERRARTERGWRPSTVATTQASVVTPAPPASPLLTSLLKSSPVVTTPQHITHPANVVDTASPSVTAPTLSMLLEKSVTSTSQHESKHAAIEHIKNQLVQIEQQLKANSPVMSPTTAPDIDDIEIKAEDVYAFRDIDIHIPPVTTMHKGNNRTTDKPAAKKEDEEVTTEIASENVATNIDEQIVKEEPLPMEVDIVEEIVPETEETAPVTEIVEDPTADVTNEVTTETEVKIAFPEVKFPTTEIKVIQPEDQKVKEEIKEVESSEPEKIEEDNIPPEDTTEDTAEETTEETVVEETVPIQEESTIECVKEGVVEEPEPIQTVESAPVDPEPTPEPIAEEREPTPTPIAPDLPVPAEEEVTSFPEDSTTIEQKLEMMERDDTEQKITEDIKKEEESEDSLPLKDILKKNEEVEENIEVQESEVKETESVEKTEIEEQHTETDDDTPMELSREEEKDGKKKRDYSRKKKSDSRTCSGSESAAEASAPDSPSASDADRQHRLWKKSVMLVYSRLCAHKYASLFLRPISDEEAPGYSMVVKRPMDLTTIRKNIDNGVTRTTAQFQRDVLLMLSNALMYNSSEHSVYTMAKEMYEEASSQLGMLLAAQAHAGLVEAPPRRKRRADTLHKRHL